MPPHIDHAWVLVRRVDDQIRGTSDGRIDDIAERRDAVQDDQVVGHRHFARVQRSGVAALALADDLAPLGIGVSVICPGFVNTNLWQSERNRPARYSKAVGKPRDAHDEMRIASASGMDPDFFGKRILASIKRGDFYILTDDAERDKIEARFQAQREALDQEAELNRTHTP